MPAVLSSFFRSTRPTLLACMFFLGFATGALAQPVVGSFSPASGPVGSSVTISGSGFSATASNNIVYFGSARANVTSASSGSLTVTVPSGASYQPISVTTGGLTGSSRSPFMVTFTGAASKFTTQSFSFAGFADTLNPDRETTKYATGDLDGDGRADIVIVDRLHNVVSIYKNTGSGGSVSFAPRFDLVTGEKPRAATVGDLDGDGKPEIIVSNLTDNTVSVYQNTTVGSTPSFAAKLDFATAFQPATISIADMDRDGRPDLVVNTINLEGFVSVLRNTGSTGSISFAPKVDVQTGSGSIEELRTGDLDGDGKPDIIVPAYALGKLETIRNTSVPGTISFATPNLFDGFAYPDQVELGDFNQDGKPDVAMTLYIGYFVLIFQNNSTAGNISFQPLTYFNTANNTNGIAVNDYDGDGLPDLAIGGTDGNGNGGMALHRNLSSGGGTSFSGAAIVPTGYYAHPVSADFNNDGRPDLAINASAASVVVWRNRVTGPQLYSFTPTSGKSGDVITIQGDNLGTVNGVKFGGVPSASFTIQNANTISAVLGVGSSGDVRLIAPTDSVSLSGFEFTGPPVIQSFSPTSAGPGDYIIIKGQNFTGATEVRVAGHSFSFDVLDPYTIRVPVGPIGTDSVTVINAYGRSSVSGFQYIARPLILGFSPGMTISGTTVTITGYNFTGATAVSFGGVPASSFNVVDSTTIQAVVAGGATGKVKVTTPIGSHEQPGFIYVPPPVITSFSPVEAAQGDTVIIKGQNFAYRFQDLYLSAVKFGGQPAFSYAIRDSFTVEARVNQGASGAITIESNRGNTSLPGFIFIQPPVIRSISPTVIGPGSVVTITGNEFTRVNAVSFGGVPASAFAVLSDTVITATVGAGASGYARLTSPRHTVNGGPLTYLTTPFIYDVTPASGAVGSTVTINGINFQPDVAGNAVYFGGVKANILSATGNKIVVKVPAGAGYRPITVTRLADSLDTRSNERFITTFPVDPAAFNDSSFAGAVDFTTGTNPLFVKHADLDGDGKIDMVVINQGSPFVSIFRNTSAPGRLSFAPRTDVPIGYNAKALAVADMDGDAFPDLIISNTDPGQTPFVHVFKNKSSAGRFEFQDVRTLGMVTYFAGHVDVADFNLDGKMDVVTTCTNCSGPAFIDVCTNTSANGVMSFQAPVRFGYPTNGVVQGINNGLEVTDYDRDGRPDVVVGMYGSSSLYVFHNTTQQGSFIFFDPGVVDNYGGYAGLPTFTPHVASLGGTPYPDIVSGSFVYRNVKGSLVELMRTSIYADHVYDLNGDGRPDLIGTDIGNGSLSILKNTGDGAGAISFATGYKLNTGGSQFMEVGDLDGDGKPEIVLSYRSLNILRILRNRIGEATPPAPKLIAMTPDSSGADGQVLITGSNLGQTTAVTFGGVPARYFTVLSNDSVLATVGDGATGKLVVTAPGGADSLAGFRFIGPPVITSFSPTSGIAGTVVSIKGSGFSGATQVSFGGVPASSFQLIGPDSIVAVVGNGESGVVSVTARGGTTSSGLFIFYRKPAITGFTPVLAATGGQVTIYGNNFNGVGTVTFGGVPAPSFYVTPNNQGIVATVGAGASGSIAVFNPAGKDSIDGFKFIFPPTVSSFLPTLAGKGAVVTIKGHFPPIISGVSFGGTDAASFTVVDSTTITAVLGSGASGNVVVKTIAGDSQLGGFTYGVVTGVNDPSTANVKDLTVSPNPARDIVLMKHPATLKASSIRFVDIAGHTVKLITPARNANSTEANVQDLRPGIYIIVWTDGSRRFSRTLEIHR